MAAETATNLWPGIEGSGFDDPELAGDDAPREKGYSIRGKAGDSIDEQLRLANYHIERAAQERHLMEAQAAPIEERIAELQARADAIRRDGEEAAARHEGFVRSWLLDPEVQAALRIAPGSKKRRITLADADCSLRAKPGTTALDQRAVIALAQDDPDSPLWTNGVVRVENVVDAAKARKWFRLVDGRTVDGDGVIVEPVRYYGADGQELESPVLSQVELPGDTVTIKYTGGTE